MERRTLLKYLGISVVDIPVSVFIERITIAANPSSNYQIHWGYIGNENPQKWGTISPEFKSCSIGIEQSPINIEKPIAAKIGNISFSYQNAPLRILHNGRTIQINYEPGSQITIAEQTFNLRQFHFHTPSEHLYQGKPYPLEMHLVHQDENKNLAVIGIFLKEGKANQALEKICSTMPMKETPEKYIANVMVNAAEFLPENKHFYEYFGSLTTPPCSEGVRWIVMAEPIEISTEQVQKFKQAIPLNARPVQNLNHRFLLENA